MLLFATSSCGYTFAAGAGLVSLTHGAPVNVVPFQNDSFEADAALLASRAAGRAIAERGGTIATASGTLELRGTVERMAAVPTGTGWWQVEGRVHLELIDPAKGNKALARSTVSDTETYRSATDTEGTEASRRIALQRLLQKLLAAGVDRLTP